MRRIGIARGSRETRFTEFAEVVWWVGHPFVAWVLDKMAVVHGEKLKALMLRTRDLSLVKARVLPLLAEQQQRLAVTRDEMDRHVPEILAGIEEQCGDALSLAWTETPVIQ